jgi:hypothetical protein
MPINALLYQVYLQEMHLSMSGEDNEKAMHFLRLARMKPPSMNTTKTAKKPNVLAMTMFRERAPIIRKSAIPI